MSDLLASPPFSERDDSQLLRELNALTRWHREGCAGYREVWPDRGEASHFGELPFLHVGAFKHRLWRTEGAGVRHLRALKSSATGGVPSRILLDSKSGLLQAQSSAAILESVLGAERRPLLVLDDARALSERGEVGARVTAAMSLRPLASSMSFLLDGGQVEPAVNWPALVAVCAESSRLLVYGFTWMLWTAWARAELPPEARRALAKTEVQFVHSGGWKRLEASRVDRAKFDAELLSSVGPGSGVLDFYGLVEQVGLVYPRCRSGFHHVPRWGAVLARDPWTLRPLVGEPGMLQFLNSLAYGAPYHSVLTEDLGIVSSETCACGRPGQRFSFEGRMPDAELRGCSNV